MEGYLAGLATIIEAGKDNPLGIVALIAILITWTVIIFFKEASVSVRIATFMLVAVAPIALALALYKEKVPEQRQCNISISGSKLLGPSFMAIPQSSADRRTRDASCASQCGKDPKCIAWVTDGTNYPGNNCWTYHELSDIGVAGGAMAGIRTSCTYISKAP